DKGKLKAVVTQNVDGLHQKAGSKNVYEIHGTMSTCHCTKCGKEYPGTIVFETGGIPRCTCGEMIRPDVVLYGEMLTEAYSLASYYIFKSDVLLVAGTSLVVEPASGLVKLYKGKHMIIINDTETPYDEMAEIVIHKPLGEVFNTLMDHIIN
ncbi:MAG: NAD-dependent protein deacylase, partial [Lachnospiraceae bacterium]|nr:NAD-dependent protein deacylase [Lachnospiraceae bacterium]